MNLIKKIVRGFIEHEISRFECRGAYQSALAKIWEEDLQKSGGSSDYARNKIEGARYWAELYRQEQLSLEKKLKRMK